MSISALIGGILGLLLAIPILIIAFLFVAFRFLLLIFIVGLAVVLTVPLSIIGVFKKSEPEEQGFIFDELYKDPREE